MRTLIDLLEPHSLLDLGACQPDGYDGTMVLIGPKEPDFWPHFSDAPEYTDGAPNALDRWSKRVLDGVAHEAGGTAYYPFGGPPYHPFFTWALQSGRFWSSPIQFLVHETEGLFASFRGAILLQEDFAISGSGESPCESCFERPCLTSCPVDAFVDGYDVDGCKSFLRSPEGNDCMQRGCAARRACPVGQGNRIPDQAAFHMKAFL